VVVRLDVETKLSEKLGVTFFTLRKVRVFKCFPFLITASTRNKMVTVYDSQRQTVHPIQQEQKTAALVYLLRVVIPAGQQTIVFAATRHHVEYIHTL
jgi:superfamily II DNA/RNA helicase